MIIKKATIDKLVNFTYWKIESQFPVKCCIHQDITLYYD